MKRKSNLFFLLLLLAGLSLILYPSVSNWWNTMHQTRVVASYVEQVEDLSEDQREAMYQEAKEYNERLASQPSHYNLSDEELKEYNQTLDVSGTGMMAYITIPKINIELPIYHGTEESILQIAIGHIAGSSLPIGGNSTHSVISGHTGLPSALLFTHINRLVEGDTFTITSLDKTITYQVDQIRIVLPDELNDLTIEEGKDYCTLVTCTPYGINTHRLLVRGHRIKNAASSDVHVKADALQVHPDLVAAIIAVIIILFYVIFILIPNTGGRKKRG